MTMTRPTASSVSLTPAKPFHTPTTLSLRHALGDFATGVTIITARATEGEFAGQLTGMTVNSFTSVSLDPPLVLWNLSLGSPSVPIFQQSTHYAVNILAADQAELSQRFARRSEDKFSNLDYTPAAGGAALLPGCVAWFECRVVARYPGGDHVILLGEVERFKRAAAHPAPLLFHHGKYHAIGDAITP